MVIVNDEWIWILFDVAGAVIRLENNVSLGQHQA
jgi:hypothetical protein